MKKITVNKTFIHHIDLHPASENTLVFVHGNSHSLNTFRHQFASSELAKFRIVALDLPGHGSSGQLACYNLKDLSNAVVKLVSELKLKSYILLGHSLGGHAVIESLTDIKPAGLLIWGTPPLSIPLEMEAFHPHPAMTSIGKNVLTVKEVNELLFAFYLSRKITQLDMAEFNQTHGEFRGSIASSLGNLNYQDEVKLLANFTGPMAILHGIHDGLINLDYIKKKVDARRLWKKKIIEVDSSHNLHIEDQIAFNQRVKEFADFVFDQHAIC